MTNPFFASPEKGFYIIFTRYKARTRLKPEYFIRKLEFVVILFNKVL